MSTFKKIPRRGTPEWDRLTAARLQVQEIDSESKIILKDPTLIDLINQELGKRIVGEEQSRITIFLIACGKYVDNAQISSFNLFLNQESGAGKDFVGKAVVSLLPSDSVHIRTRISPTAFTYWHWRDTEWTWDNKICFLSDVSSGVLNCDALKLMMSDGTHSTIVINNAAVDIEIRGKPVIILTAARSHPNSENIRRLPILELDATNKQTMNINVAQAKAAATGQKIEYEPKIKKALSYLQRVSVRVPFAEKLPDYFPHEHLIMRTHFQRLLDYIKASAALYQFQREKDEDGFVLATTQDYDNAVIALRTTTSNRFMIPLTATQKKLLAICRSSDRFSVSDIESRVPFLEKSMLYKYLGELQEYGFLNSQTIEVEGKKRPVRYYWVVDIGSLTIPFWNELESCQKIGINGMKELMENTEKTELINNSVKSVNSSVNSTLDISIKDDFNDLYELISEGNGVYPLEKAQDRFSAESLDRWRSEGLICELPAGELRLSLAPHNDVEDVQ